MSLITRDNLMQSPLVNGDAGVVLKEDGTFRVFNLHKNVDPKNLTAAQREQMRRVMALSYVLQTPTVLDMLIDAAEQISAAEGVVNLGLVS